MDNVPSQIIPVEIYFDEFVKEFGGEKISDELAKKPEFKHGLPNNADYLFRSDEVIAELKCLEEDTYTAEEFSVLFNRLYAEWKRKGLIQEERFGRTLVQTNDLPLECQLEIEKLVNKRLKNVITKANKQIKLTKETLGLPNAKGVLLLVSDGNYFLQPNQVLGLAARIMKSHFSSINSLIYFTVNMTVKMPGTDRNTMIWVEGYREGVQRVPSDFLEKLSNGWTSFLSRKTGEEIPQYLAKDHSIVERTKFRREIYVPILGGAGDAWRLVQATLEFDNIYRITSGGREGERLQFSRGELVRCKNHRFSDGRVGLVAYEKYDDVIVTIRRDKFGQKEVIMRPVDPEAGEQRIVVPHASHKIYALSLAAIRRISTSESEFVHEASSAKVKTHEEAYEKGYAEARRKWPESEGWSHSVLIQEVNLNLRILLQTPRAE